MKNPPLTTGEKLAAITEVIADKELKRGCFYRNISVPIVFQYEAEIISERESIFEVYNWTRMGFGTEDREYFEEKIGAKILGTPPDLARVMDWLQKRGFYVILSQEGTLRMKRNAKETWTECEWDFSKSLLRDQSQEFINILYDFLPYFPFKNARNK